MSVMVAIAATQKKTYQVDRHQYAESADREIRWNGPSRARVGP
jgi:hypothetical protein